MSTQLIMTFLVHPDFSVLGLLKFSVNLNCKAYSSQWLMSKITVYPQACMLGFFFSSLNSICFFLDICFKIKKCFGQVNTLKFGQSKSLFRASQMALAIKNPPANAGRHETKVRSLSWEDPLKEGMATHSSILAWRIPWTEEPGRLQSIGLQRVGRDQSDSHE